MVRAAGTSFDLERQRRHPIHGNVTGHGVLVDSRNGLQSSVESIEVRQPDRGALVDVGQHFSRSHQQVFGIADVGFGVDNLHEAADQHACPIGHHNGESCLACHTDALFCCCACVADSKVLYGFYHWPRSGQQRGGRPREIERSTNPRDQNLASLLIG